MKRLSKALLSSFVLMLRTVPRLTWAQQNPVAQYGNLYHMMQTHMVAEDSKDLADYKPRIHPDSINKHYLEQVVKPGFNVQSFVGKYFSAPAAPDSNYQTNPDHSITDHIAALWPYLTRQSDGHQHYSKGSLVALPFPYIVPGGRFREIYYWDSYFTMLGLQHSQHSHLIGNMTDNFNWLINTLGFVPNGNRAYYLSRSQPPFFAQMVKLMAQREGDQVYEKYFPALKKEYDFWMRGCETLSDKHPEWQRVVRMPDGSVLNRYYDTEPTARPEAFIADLHHARQSGRNPADVFRDTRAAAESGWDFSSRWLADPHNMATIETTRLAPVDLNSLLYQMEITLGIAARVSKQPRLAEWYQNKAQERAAAINKYCWNDQLGIYADYHLDSATYTQRHSLATVYPLYAGIASTTQAAMVAHTLERHFLKPGGWVTTLNFTEQQWDSPNGWAPLQWLAYVGLKNYGFGRLAAIGRQRWLALNERVFEKTRKMVEKYDVVNPEQAGGGGEYPVQDGFGWTNGVYLHLLNQNQEDVLPLKKDLLKHPVR